MNTTQTQPPMQADMPVVIEPEVALQLWADRVTHAYQRSVASTIAVGHTLIQAKATVSHGDWGRLFKGHPRAVAHPAPITQHTAEAFMRIASHPTLSNSTHGSNLPASWRTLVELARLKPAVLEKHLESGRVHSELTRAEVDYLRETSKPARPSSHGSSGLIDESDAPVNLAIDEWQLRKYATSVAVALHEQLQFLDEDGRITIRGKPSYSCPECGHLHHCDGQ